jgi:hypothetical protein
LTIGVAAEFCTWTEQRHHVSSISSLRLAKTLEVPNTILEDNSLSFPMVHQTAPTGLQFARYDSQKLDRLLNQHFWQIIPSCIKQFFFPKFSHDFPRNFVYEQCRQGTQLSSGYSHDPFWHTVWPLLHFEFLLQYWTCYGQIGLQVFGHVFGPENG